MKAILEIGAIAIFKGVARRVAYVGKTLKGDALDQIFDRGEGKPPARIFVEVLLNAGAANFVAKFQVVLVDFPGEAVDELIVGVYTMAGVTRSCAGLREKCSAAGWGRRKKEYGQAGRTARGGTYGGVAEADAARIKTLVLWKEAFSKPVPAITKVVHDGRRENVNVREGNELDASGSDSVETGEFATGGVESQWKLLGAVAKEVAAGENVVLVDVVVDLADNTAQVVIGLSNGSIVRRTDTACGETSRVVGDDTGDVIGGVAGPETK